MVSQPALEQYRRQRRRTLAAVAASRRAWGHMGEDFDSSWRHVGPRVTALVAAAQYAAASDGADYVGAALAAMGQSVDPVAMVSPRAFAGIASDGRPLESLLYGAVIEAKQADATSLTMRLTVGRDHLDGLVQTTVADASRDASSAAVTARPRVKWVRMVNPPCCQRCAVLAGRVYSYSTAFKRHPLCNCLMLPQTVANPHAVGIHIGPEDVKDLTRLQRKAIADGHDFNQVINDYNRNGKWHLPPTRVDDITARAASRTKAVDALAKAGYLA